MGPRDPAQVQLHDFNPGDLNERGQPDHFPDGGVFWTRRIPGNAVEVLPGRGVTHFQVHQLPLFDFTNVTNAILRTGPRRIRANADVRIRWRGSGELQQVHQETFGGVYENAFATLEWAARDEAGFFFTTAGSSQRVITHAFTAFVRNGLFFAPEV